MNDDSKNTISGLQAPALSIKAAQVVQTKGR